MFWDAILVYYNLAGNPWEDVADAPSAGPAVRDSYLCQRLATSAYRYESRIEEQMMEIYQEAFILGQEFEVKIVEMHHKIKSGNTTERFRPLLNKLENIIEKLDSKEYDWIDVSMRSSAPSFKVSRWPIFVYIFSAMICLVCSSIFHLFKAHSLKMNKIVSRLDYAGITILLAGSFYPHIYYAFFCIPGKIYAEFMTLYLSGITGASMFTFCISVIPRFQAGR